MVGEVVPVVFIAVPEDPILVSSGVRRTKSTTGAPVKPELPVAP